MKNYTNCEKKETYNTTSWDAVVSLMFDATQSSHTAEEIYGNSLAAV